MSDFDSTGNEQDTSVDELKASLQDQNMMYIPSIASSNSLAANTLNKLGNESDLQKRNPPIVKGCFIATAAMGSELHPHVELLRKFRDNILLQSRHKNSFERLLDRYYSLSPPIAKAMKTHRLLKILLRYLLVYPIVFGIKGILPLVNVILGIERDAKRR